MLLLVLLLLFYHGAHGCIHIALWKKVRVMHALFPGQQATQLPCYSAVFDPITYTIACNKYII